jgi:hypothetical protein
MAVWGVGRLMSRTGLAEKASIFRHRDGGNARILCVSIAIGD